MIPRFAQGIAKLIALCILIAATWHIGFVIGQITNLVRHADSSSTWLGFAANIVVWALAVTGALGILQNRALGYYVVYLATLVSIFGNAFSYIPFSSFWLPEPLTVKGREWIGIWLVNIVVVVVLLWCHCMTRMLRYDSRLKELREKSKNK